MKYIDKHWSPAIQMEKIVAFSEAVYTKIADGSIGTEESMGWFRREIHVAMPHTSETRYGSAHCYRSLLDVLGMSVPGDNFFLMGSGADSNAYKLFTSRGVTSLSGFNRCVGYVCCMMYCYSRQWSVLYDAVCCMIIAMSYDLLLAPVVGVV